MKAPAALQFFDHERRALGAALRTTIDRRLARKAETDDALRLVVADLLQRVERLEALSAIDPDQPPAVRRVKPFPVRASAPRSHR